MIIHYLLKAFGKPESSLALPVVKQTDILNHPAFEPPKEGTDLVMAFKESFSTPDPPSTCDPQLGEKENTDKVIRSDCVLDQPNPNAFLLLKEYENENPMNNSQWIDNVNLYDEFGDRFSEYERTNI